MCTSNNSRVLSNKSKKSQKEVTAEFKRNAQLLKDITIPPQQQSIRENLEDQIINSLSKYGVHKQWSDKIISKKNGKEGTYNFCRKNICELKDRFTYNHNWFITLNTFQHHHSTDDDISCLIANFVDLDTVKAGIRHFDWRGLNRFLRTKYHIPATTIVFSGHGFYFIFFYRHPIFLARKTSIKVREATSAKWKHVEFDIAKAVNKFSRLKYHTDVVDLDATNPSRLLRQSNTTNVKYQDPTSPYTMPVDVKLLYVNPRNRASIKELTEHFASKRDLITIKRYHYYLAHKNYYDQKTKRIEYIKGVKYRIRMYKLYHQNQKSHLHQLTHQHQSVSYFNKQKWHKIFKNKVAHKRMLQGFYHHIHSPYYDLYGHVELAMFVYMCLLLMDSKITIPSALKYLKSFINKTIKPKLKSNNKRLSNRDANMMFNKIKTEITHFRDKSYSTKVKRSTIASYSKARFYIISSDAIVRYMGFKGRLYLTKYDKRNKQRDWHKSYQKHLIKAVKYYHHYKRLSISKLSKQFKISRTTIYKILKMRKS